MTEQQYPIHLRKIGEHQIAEFLETLIIELDTHEKMFLELCQVTRERDALRKLMKDGTVEDLPLSKDSARIALRLIERYVNANLNDKLCVDFDTTGGYRFYFESDMEVKPDGFD